VKTYAPSNVSNSYINSYPKARLDSRVPPIKICTVKKLSHYLQIYHPKIESPGMEVFITRKK
jgi:hypothetical protein